MAIKCTIHTNSTCIKCEALEEEMIHIGAFIMCKKCWKEEFFAIEKFTTDSDLYKTYKKWLDVYYEKYS